MDENRDRKIEVGAGLQDERINQEFKDFLERWSLPVLAMLLVIVGIYSGSKWYRTYRQGRVDAAFVAYEAARGPVGDDGIRQGSPDTLIAFAKEHAGDGAIPLLARLDAADIYLGAARRGIALGADLYDFSGDDILTDDQTEAMLASADEQYSYVADRAAGSDARATMQIRALFGVASVAISRGDTDQARSVLEKLAERADALGYEAHARAARDRIDKLNTWAQPVALLDRSEVKTYLPDPFAEQLDPDTQLLRPIPADEVPEALRRDPSLYPEGFGQPPMPPEEPDPDAPAQEPDQAQPEQDPN